MHDFKISKQREKLDDKLAKQSDLNLAQQSLLTCIKTLVAQDFFWKNKVRFPNQTTRKRPYGIQRMQSLLKNFEGNPAQCCHEIIACCNARHSKYWQWAHHFFRGRDNTTNTVYGILKAVVITDRLSIEAAINALNQLQTAHTEKVPQYFANRR